MKLMGSGIRLSKHLVALAVLCIGSVLLAACAKDEPPAFPEGSWQQRMGKIRAAVRGDEADPAFAATWSGYRSHLQAITGLPVETFEASDYNGVIQAVASGQVDFATMGAGAYANVDTQVGSKALPFLLARQAEGNTGYYSALAVRTASPFRTLADLKGKTIAYIDFNSTSGYIYPRRELIKQGLDPERFFAKSIMAGGGTQALLAMMNGRVDAAMITVSAGTPETGFATGNHVSLARRGLINLDEMRIIWTAGPMPNSPYVMRTDRPQAFTDVLRGALAMLPYEKPDVWASMGQAPGNDFHPVSRADYADIIAIRAEDISQRRSGSGE